MCTACKGVTVGTTEPNLYSTDNCCCLYSPTQNLIEMRSTDVKKEHTN